MVYCYYCTVYEVQMNPVPILCEELSLLSSVRVFIMWLGTEVRDRMVEYVVLCVRLLLVGTLVVESWARLELVDGQGTLR